MTLPNKVEKGWMAKYRRANVLPKRMSMLIYLTLADVNAVEKMKNVKIDMGIWGNRPDKRHKCRACAAGAVAIRTLKDMNPNNAFGDFGPSLSSDEGSLYAIEKLRMGMVAGAAGSRGFPERPYHRFDRNMTPYEVDPAAWKRELRQIANEMYAEGL